MLQIDTRQVLKFTTHDLVGQRIAVLGISGSGKTNTVATLAEELLPNLPMTICDVEGEYYGLKERFDLLVAGRSEHAEIPLLVENAAALAEASIRRGISVILDLSDYDPDEMQEILLAYFQQLWKLSTSLKSPYEIVVEEAHEFVPQGQNTPLKKVLTRFALRGRKRGIGVILASQRSAKVEKDLLSQANILVLHSVVHPADLFVYKDLLPLPGKEVEQQLRELVPGEAFVARGKQVERVHIRRRHTFHAGATPTLEGTPPHLKRIDAALLEELRELTARSIKEGGSDEIAKLRKQVRDAERVIAEQHATIEELEHRLELVSTLRVQMPPGGLPQPDTMHIQRATVHHLHTPAAPSPPPNKVIEATVAIPAIESVKNTSPFNEAKFTSLQRRLRQAPPLEKEILRVLVEQRRALSAQEIAAWLNRSEAHVQNHPPQNFLKLGIIVRTRRGTRGYLYRSALAEYLQQEFPGADNERLQQTLLAALAH